MRKTGNKNDGSDSENVPGSDSDDIDDSGKLDVILNVVCESQSDDATSS